MYRLPAFGDRQEGEGQDMVTMKNVNIKNTHLYVLYFIFFDEISMNKKLKFNKLIQISSKK